MNDAAKTQDSNIISGMRSLLENARISKELIRSQPDRPYEHYWKEFLKTQQMRNATLGRRQQPKWMGTVKRYRIPVNPGLLRQ